MSDHPEFVQHAGASLATSNVMSGAGALQWAERKSPKDPADNGWRFISAIDDEAYLSDGSSWAIVDFNEVCAIEPAVISIIDLPVGSDLQLVEGAAGKLWIDDETGVPIPRDQLYPRRPDVDS